MMKIVIAFMALGLTLLIVGNAPAVSLSIQANGSDGPVNIFEKDDLSLTGAVDSEGDGSAADWWIVYETGGLWHSYVIPNSWGETITPVYQGNIVTVPSFPIFNGILPASACTFYLALDTSRNGVVDAPLFHDSVRVNILPDDARAKSYDAIVVGAGIAGLTAAYFLKDLNIAVLEKNDRVGGRALSGKRNQFTYAKGTEYLGKPGGPLAQIIRELGLAPKEIPAPMDGSYYNDAFYWGDDGLAWMFIEGGANDSYKEFVATTLQLYEKYNEASDIASDPVLGPLDGKTSKEWFDEMGVAPMIREKYNVAARGIFGASITEISALSFIPEIAFDFSDELLSELTAGAIDADDNTPDQAGVHTESYSFTTGITEITDAIAQHLGDAIRLNSTVTSVTEKDDLYVVNYTDNDGINRLLTSRLVIMATPAPIALQIAPTLLGAERTAIMREIDYSPYITAALFSDAPIFTRAFDLSVPDGYFFTDVYDSTWVQRQYDAAVAGAADDYVVSIYAAPQSYTDRDLPGVTDNRVLSRIFEDWRKIFSRADVRYIARDIEEMVTGHDIHRFTYAYPVMTKGSNARLERLNSINTGGFLLAGDYLIYPTFEEASKKSNKTARKAQTELEAKYNLKI